MKQERNAPCPCGSGKKYKKCCLLKGQSIKKLTDKLKPEDSYDDDSDDNSEMQTMLIRGLTNMRKMFMKDKLHIKEYNKLRKLHSEIVDTMIESYHKGYKFLVCQPQRDNAVELSESDFDLDTQLGLQAFFDVMIYNKDINLNCITKTFLQNKRYKNPEKITLLQNMLDSELGLFETTDTDFKEGYANLKEIFTGKEYKIIDIGLSGEAHYKDFYCYTRIITHNNISFGTGLNFVFKKTNSFIKAHINEHKKNYNPKKEHQRFFQLYKYLSDNPSECRVVTT